MTCCDLHLKKKKFLWLSGRNCRDKRGSRETSKKAAEREVVWTGML